MSPRQRNGNRELFVAVFILIDPAVRAGRWFLNPLAGWSKAKMRSRESAHPSTVAGVLYPHLEP